MTGSSSDAEASHVSHVKCDRKTSARLLQSNIKAAGADAQVISHVIIAIIHITKRFGPSDKMENAAPFQVHVFFIFADQLFCISYTFISERIDRSADR